MAVATFSSGNNVNLKKFAFNENIFTFLYNRNYTLNYILMNLIATIGDCNGIGIECLAKALLSLERDEAFMNDSLVDIVGNIDTVTEYLDRINIKYTVIGSQIRFAEKLYNVIDTNPKASIEFGASSAQAGKLAASAIEYAVKATIAGNYDAMLTQPISKHSVSLAGWRFPGHTEMIAARCGADTPLMILCTDKVRCALATIHTPLRSVPNLISKGFLAGVIRLFDMSLKIDFGVTHPKIAVLGLNPHAGEEGDIGEEEINMIIPAIELCRNEDIDVSEPFAADGFFAHRLYEQYDGYIAMYHDQGLIPLKMLAEGSGVNFTAGLTIVRTSPAHGTAFDIAGRGVANPQSTIDAIRLAKEISERRKNK